MISTKAGFTLLETIVALVILSTALIGFLDFLSTALNGANRVQQASIAYDRHANALELVKTINPMETPQGSFALEHYHIQWASRLINNVQQSSRYPSGPGPFKIALYRVTLSFPDDRNVSAIDVTKYGYHRQDTPLGMPPASGSAGNSP